MLKFAKQILGLTWSLINTPRPEQMLHGHQFFRPFFKYQRAWIKHFYPDEELGENITAWQYLQKYVMPLIKLHASSYHLEGIRRLQLDGDRQPDFNQFQSLFYEASNGFSIHPVDDEIEAKEYYSLIQQKKFPCIQTLRSHGELFCAGEPDFWHEAVGHIAPLCFPEVQSFYLEIADAMLSARSDAEFEEQLAVAWTLTEYGFLNESGQPKMFGAAMVGSHLAHTRYLNNVISIEAAEKSAIINSGFYSENLPIPRDSAGRMRFFCLDGLDYKSFCSVMSASTT